MTSTVAPNAGRNTAKQARIVSHFSRQLLHTATYGNGFVGKTSTLGNMFKLGDPTKMTFFDIQCVEFPVEVDGNSYNVKMKLTDTAGQEIFRDLRVLATRNQDILIFCVNLDEKIIMPGSEEDIKLRSEENIKLRSEKDIRLRQEENLQNDNDEKNVMQHLSTFVEELPTATKAILLVFTKDDIRCAENTQQVCSEFEQYLCKTFAHMQIKSVCVNNLSGYDDNQELRSKYNELLRHIMRPYIVKKKQKNSNSCGIFPSKKRMLN